MLEVVVGTLLGLPSVAWDRPRDAPYPIHDVHEAEYAARGLRLDWKLGIDPIPNVVELFGECGIKVLSIDLANIDGLTACARRSAEEVVSVIVVNRNAGGNASASR